MAYYVYVLVNPDGKMYVGQTSDLDRRLAEHNDRSQNRKKYTSLNRGPWGLAHKEGYDSRAEAMRRERFLKSGKGRAWLKGQVGGASPPEAD